MNKAEVVLTKLAEKAHELNTRGHYRVEAGPHAVRLVVDGVGSANFERKDEHIVAYLVAAPTGWTDHTRSLRPEAMAESNITQSIENAIARLNEYRDTLASAVLRAVVALFSQPYRRHGETEVAAVSRSTGLSIESVRAALDALRPHGVNLLQRDRIGIAADCLERLKRDLAA